MIVLYEDIVKNLMDLLNKLYRDLDLEYSDNFKEWIFNYILVGSLNNLYYGIV